MTRTAFAIAVTLLAFGPTMAAGADPWPVFAVDTKVRIKIGEARLHDVVSVEGHLLSTAVITFREGGGEGGTMKLPGPTTPGDVIVRRNVRTDDVLWSWYQQILAGDVQKKDVSVIYVGANGQAAVRFDLLRCFPSAYALHAGAGVAAVTSVEAVTLSCEGASRTGL